MGLINRGKGATRDAQDKLAAAARAQEERVARAVGERRYDKVRGKVGSAASAGAGAVSSLAESAMNRAGATTGARKVGAGARNAMRELHALPLVGLTPEMLAARNGVPTLRKRLRTDPTDPQNALWLAESLLRTQREARVVRAANTVVNPGSLVVRGVAGVAVKLGQELREPAARRLLKTAFATSVTRVRTTPDDAVALHVLSRVYLVQSMHADAVRLALLAAEADVTDGRPLVTAAFAKLRDGDDRSAAMLAERAVERGCSIGHEVTAELLRRTLRQRKDLTPKDRSDQYAAELGKVHRRDRRSYYGASLGAPAVTWAVASQEARKTATLTRRVAGAARRKP